MRCWAGGIKAGYTIEPVAAVRGPCGTRIAPSGDWNSPTPPQIGVTTMPRTHLVWQSLTVAVFGLFIGSPAFGQDRRPPVAADKVAEELTRGPIHEAFGQPTVFNPQGGPIAPKAPPELIEEVPPEQ